LPVGAGDGEGAKGGEGAKDEGDETARGPGPASAGVIRAGAAAGVAGLAPGAGAGRDGAGCDGAGAGGGDAAGVLDGPVADWPVPDWTVTDWPAGGWPVAGCSLSAGPLRLADTPDGALDGAAGWRRSGAGCARGAPAAHGSSASAMASEALWRAMVERWSNVRVCAGIPPSR